MKRSVCSRPATRRAYPGCVGLEYIPAGETAAGLGWQERLA